MRLCQSRYGSFRSVSCVANNTHTLANKYFPRAQNPTLLRSLTTNRQAKPYHYKDRAVILGDSAHSMVPFYGQGLNCGLEDVRVLHILLRDAGVDPTARPPDGQEDTALASALARYSASRHEDLVAACELAMDN